MAREAIEGNAAAAAAEKPPARRFEELRAR